GRSGESIKNRSRQFCGTEDRTGRPARCKIVLLSIKLGSAKLILPLDVGCAARPRVRLRRADFVARHPCTLDQWFVGLGFTELGAGILTWPSYLKPVRSQELWSELLVMLFGRPIPWADSLIFYSARWSVVLSGLDSQL
ncbi:hypothetical protein U1Q18_003514, partial [Sarracenia purpurea var. burkii]